MVSTVNTNASAMQALNSMRETGRHLDVVSKKIQTGYKVADAFDDASTFTVAQGIRAATKQYSAVQQSLSNGEGLGQVAAAALESVSTLVMDIKTKITQMSDGSLSTAQIVVYSRDLLAQLTQVSNYLTQAVYNGRNIFTNSRPATFLSDINGTTLNLTSQSSNTSTAFNTFSAAAVVFSAAVYANPGSASVITTANTAVTTFESSINNAMAIVAAETKTITAQKSFINDIVDATKKGLGATVDADVAADSATLQALQVRQQLGTQSLSIANQEPNSLLSLFR